MDLFQLYCGVPIIGGIILFTGVGIAANHSERKFLKTHTKGLCFLCDEEGLPSLIGNKWKGVQYYGQKSVLGTDWRDYYCPRHRKEISPEDFESSDSFLDMAI
jgi:hypothetical protein